jgi:hypothetical protein
MFFEMYISMIITPSRTEELKIYLTDSAAQFDEVNKNSGDGPAILISRKVAKMTN